MAAALTAVAMAAISGGVLATGATAATTPSTATIEVATAVPGVTLGLFTAQSDDTLIAAEWATATSVTSGAEHVATFTVPITGNAITADGVPPRERLWVGVAEAPTAAPAGYSLPTALGTGPLTADKDDPHQLRTYSFQTPQLKADGLYQSGTHFMTRSTTSGTSDARYEGSTGTWTTVRDNPAMPTSCSGLNVAVVLDFSASVSDDQVTEVKNVAKAYVDALAGTPSSLQVFPFGTKALTASGKTSLTTQENVDALKSFISTFKRPSTAQYTNWDAALREIPTGAFDVIVMVTDGMPTVYGSGATGNGSAVTRFAEMEAAIAAANAHKAATTHNGNRTHIKAFGVGNGINSAAALANLEAIASPDAVTRTQDYAAVAAALRAQVLADCTPSVSVTKLVEPWNFGEPGVVRAPAAGWEFTAQVSGMKLGDGSLTKTTPDGGGVMWRFVADTPGQVAEVTVTEAQQPGYRLLPQDGQNAACVVKNASTPVAGEPLTVADADNGFTLTDLGAGDMVTCTIINKEPPPPEVGKVTVAGSAQVDYDWAITKDVTTDRVAQTAPGTDVEFGYELHVTATRKDAPITVTGSVTLTNPRDATIPVGDVTASVGGVPATVSGPTSIAPNGSVDLTFTAALAEAPGDVPVTVTVPGRGPVSASLASSAITTTQSDRFAVVTDTFPEFAIAYPDLTARDAEQVIAAGGATFTYTAERGADVPFPDGSADYPNTATVTPQGPGLPGDDQDPEALTDSETVTVTTGAPLLVNGVTVTGAYAVDYDWAVSKEVVGAADQEVTPGEDATFSYLLRVTTSQDVGPLTVDGTVSVTNPSGTPLTLASGDLTVTVDDAQATVTLPSATGTVTTVPAGAAVEATFTATLESPGEQVSVVVGLPDRDDTQAALDVSTITPTVHDATATLEDTFPEFAAAYPDLTLDAEQVIAAGGVTFEYTAERGATTPADGGSEQFVNVVTVHPSGPDPLNPPANGGVDDQDPDDLTDDATVTVRTPPEYDLALRMWVAEVWHGDDLLFERNSDPSDAGPDRPIPHATFDHDEFDIQVGDLVVYDVHVFNQGDRTARVDELVSYRATGLELAGDELLAGAVDHDNTGWGDSPDGSGHLLMPDAGMVLAPGESSEVTLTLVVTPDAMSDDGEAAERFAFAEIAAFSGWVPAVEVSPLRALAMPALTAPVPHDGVTGYWSADVVDVDSMPDRENGGTDVDNATLVYHSWEDNEIHETNTSMLWDSDDDDFDNDEDDHDGSIIRVFTAGYRESLAAEEAEDGDAETGDGLQGADDAEDTGDTGDTGTGDAGPNDSDADSDPTSGGADGTDPDTITVAAGGVTSGVGVGTRVTLLTGAAALLTVGGVLLTRRARESTSD